MSWVDMTGSLAKESYGIGEKEKKKRYSILQRN